MVAFGSSLCVVFLPSLLKLTLRLQVPLLTMMPIIYFYNVSLSGDCDTSRSAVSKIRIVQGAISRNVSEPAFVPQFHGFEMFVWSLLSPEVLLSCFAVFSQLRNSLAAPGAAAVSGDMGQSNDF